MDIMRIIMVADLFERSYSDFISELKDNGGLKTFMGVKKYKWSYYYPSEGYYVGFKLIVAIDAENYELSGYELHDGCPNDAIILIPLIEKLHSVKRMRMGDVIICDMGSNSLKIYITTINRFFVITIIYPGMNTNMSEIDANLVPSLDIWAGEGYLLDIWNKIRSGKNSLG